MRGKRGKSLACCLVVLGMLLGGIAWAQVETAPDRAVYPKTTILDIANPESIIGTVVGPASSFFKAKKNVRFDLLVPVRGDFYPEIATTADCL